MISSVMPATPYLDLDLSKVEQNYRQISGTFGERYGIFFSVKANNHPEVLRVIAENGGSFDVASAAEVGQALAAGVTPDRIAFSNPVKMPADISFAYRSGVRLFAVDSHDEIQKLAALAPGSSVYVRLSVDNTGSGWPLSGKFGVEVKDAVTLLQAVKDAGLDPAGVTFHVGSQCANVTNWRMALGRAGEVWRECEALGITLHLLNAGGGIPARYRGDEPTVAEIAQTVREIVDMTFPSTATLMLEPGRAMVANAGTFVATVIGTAKRGHELYVYLDAGVFSGLMETYECFWYPVETSRQGEPEENVTLAGPTCDSVDVIARGVRLPALRMGDTVRFRMAGAYTNSYERYNGFGFPEVRCMNAVASEKKKAPVGAKELVQ